MRWTTVASDDLRNFPMALATNPVPGGGDVDVDGDGKCCGGAHGDGDDGDGANSDDANGDDANGDGDDANGDGVQFGEPACGGMPIQRRVCLRRLPV